MGTLVLGIDPRVRLNWRKIAISLIDQLREDVAIYNESHRRT
jgi:hypothetical protein